MSGHIAIQPVHEGIQAPSRDLAATDQPPNKTVADAQLAQQFEVDEDGLENHEGDLFFYEFDMEEEIRRLEMMRELERRRIWAQRHQQSDEDEEGDEEEEEGEGETNPSSEWANGLHKEDPDERPAPWGAFDWRIGIAEYILEYGQEEEPLSPGRAAQVDQALFQTFPGIRKYYEEHPEVYSAGFNSDVEMDE